MKGLGWDHQGYPIGLRFQSKSWHRIMRSAYGQRCMIDTFGGRLAGARPHMRRLDRKPFRTV
jgi:hypothetical protein